LIWFWLCCLLIFFFFFCRRGIAGGGRVYLEMEATVRVLCAVRYGTVVICGLFGCTGAYCTVLVSYCRLLYRYSYHSRVLSGNLRENRLFFYLRKEIDRRLRPRYHRRRRIMHGTVLYNTGQIIVVLLICGWTSGCTVNYNIIVKCNVTKYPLSAKT